MLCGGLGLVSNSLILLFFWDETLMTLNYVESTAPSHGIVRDCTWSVFLPLTEDPPPRSGRWCRARRRRARRRCACCGAGPRPCAPGSTSCSASAGSWTTTPSTRSGATAALTVPSHTMAWHDTQSRNKRLSIAKMLIQREDLTSNTPGLPWWPIYTYHLTQYDPSIKFWIIFQNLPTYPKTPMLTYFNVYHNT